MRRILWALFISLFIHLLLVAGLGLYPHTPPQERVAVEVEIKEPPASQEKTPHQVVRQPLVPENMKAPDSEDPLAFLSAQRQRVKKQTRAAQLGKTENRSPADRSDRDSSEARRSKPLPDLRRALDQDLLRQAARQAAREKRLPSLDNLGPSTLGESLPDNIQVGTFTALNTDRYLYYSFFSRVEDLIRYRWESSVQNALDSTPREALAANIRNRWITQMEVLLNRQGEVRKILLMKPAGLPAFDQAAISAFRQARYFPNPPKEMVEDDGFIHLRYSFTVYFDPQLLARPSDQ